MTNDPVIDITPQQVATPVYSDYTNSPANSEQAEVRNVVERMLKQQHPTFADIIGMEEIKMLFARRLIFPVKAKVISNMLLYGPPGMEKAHIVRAAAGEGRYSLFYINAPQLISVWKGRMDVITREVIKKASEKVPSIILLDEAEALFDSEAGEEQSRDKVKLLSQFEALSGSGVILIATSSYPWKLDTTFVDLLKHNTYISLPTIEEIELLIKAELDSCTDMRWRFSYSSLNISSLALMMEKKSFSRADVRKVIELCCDLAVKRLAKEQTYDQLKIILKSETGDYGVSVEILQSDIEYAVKNKINPNVDVARYEKWGNLTM